MTMPTFDLRVLRENIKALGLDDETQAEYARIAQLVTTNRGLNGSTVRVRTSKPPVKCGVDGKAAYVWRMVVFQVSQKRGHQCFPTTADFDLPVKDDNGKWSSSLARRMARELDRLVDAIVHCIPKSQWHGVHRWGRAFGLRSF